MIRHKLSGPGLLLAMLLIGGCGNDGDENSFKPPAGATVNISGIVTASGAPQENVQVSAFLQSAPASLEDATTTDAQGEYTLVVADSSALYRKYEKPLFATLNTEYRAFTTDTGGLDVELQLVTEVQSVIDTAFGGMMFLLPDKAWLAVNVLNSSGVEIDGVAIDTLPVVAGGGALNCDGTLTGGNITVATPPCDPPRTGPMYFAYFDADAEVTVSFSGTSAAIVAPVRVGEVTLVETVQ